MEESSLRKDLKSIIVNSFGGKLTNSEFNQYVTKLRDYFIDYIIDIKCYKENIEKLFKYDFTRNDIIESTIHYVVTNQNVRSKSAIDDYLIALNSLFNETLNDKYNNQTLINLQPFKKLSKEVEDKIIKEGLKNLKEKEGDPPIKKDEYYFIISYLEEMKIETIKSIQVKLIISLILLYGFKYERIIDFKKRDYCEEEGILSVKYDEDNKSYIRLELPYKLNNLMKLYLIKRDKENYKNDTLFINTKGNKIDNSFLGTCLEKIKKDYTKQNNNLEESKNSFTPTGLSKYAVINMILEGVNQSVIFDLTGLKEDQYSYCQDKVNEMKNLNRNRYVNHMIRGISTYDEL